MVSMTSRGHLARGGMAARAGHTGHNIDDITRNAYGFVVFCLFILFLRDSCNPYTSIPQGLLTVTGATVWLPQCQWSNPGGYGYIDLNQTTTNPNQEQKVCIFIALFRCTLRLSGYIKYGIQVFQNVKLCWDCNWNCDSNHSHLQPYHSCKIFLQNSQTNMKNPSLTMIVICDKQNNIDYAETQTDKHLTQWNLSWQQRTSVPVWWQTSASMMMTDALCQAVTHQIRHIVECAATMCTLSPVIIIM